ncbi:MAG: hypothetical protein AB2L24_24825 [Mangrovibacterium sp.]
MKILLVGEDETIGKKIKESLTAGHEVITASKANSDFQVDITFPLSIKHLYETIGPLDACVCTGRFRIHGRFPQTKRGGIAGSYER